MLEARGIALKGRSVNLHLSGSEVRKLDVESLKLRHDFWVERAGGWVVYLLSLIDESQLPTLVEHRERE